MKISRYRLRKLYKNKKIKKKFITRTKKPTKAQTKKIADAKIVLKQQLEDAPSKGQLVIVSDEMVITKSTIPKVSWSNKKQNISLDMKELDEKYISIVGGISSSRGFEVWMCWYSAINKKRYVQFLEELREANGKQPILLVQDNCSSHHAKICIKKCKELDIEIAWLPIYSPIYSGLELIWGISKAKIKAKRLQALMNGQKPDLLQMIQDAFDSISTETCAKCIKKCFDRLN